MVGVNAWVNDAELMAMWERLPDQRIPEFVERVMVQMKLKVLQIFGPKPRVHVGTYPDDTHGGSHKASVSDFDLVPGPGWIVGPSMSYSKYVELGTRFFSPGDMDHVETREEAMDEIPGVVRGVLMEMGG